MYETITESIKVSVEPLFVEEQSSPDEGYFFWAYKIDIENLSSDPVQLRSRYWLITDASGVTQEVEGAGVVGEEPLIKPGENYSYTSGAPLHTSSGIMRGHYVMQRMNGAKFNIEIPAFSLDSPYSSPVLN